MNKPTLLFVEEITTTLSKSVVSNKTINLVLLRFKQNMFFDKTYLKKTAHIPCFILDKNQSIQHEVNRFKVFCLDNNIIIDYFFNDSEYNQELIQKFAKILNLQWALNEVQAATVRDKSVMKKFLNNNGLSTVNYKEVFSLEDIMSFIEEVSGFPFILKWRKGLSSKEVYKIEELRDLYDLHIDYSSGRYIVEEYCPNLIWCIDSVIQNGIVMGTFFAWLPYTNLDFTENKKRFAQITVNKQPTEFSFDGESLNQLIVDRLDLKNGYIHTEVFVDSFGNFKVCEFAWRTPGENMLANHSIAFGIDICEILTDIMVGRTIDKIKLFGEKCVGDIFLPVSDGIVEKISTIGNFLKIDGVINGHILYKPGDFIETKRQYTSCSGWVQIEGKTREEVLDIASRVYTNFHLQMKK